MWGLLGAALAVKSNSSRKNGYLSFTQGSNSSISHQSSGISGSASVPDVHCFIIDLNSPCRGDRGQLETSSQPGTETHTDHCSVSSYWPLTLSFTIFSLRIFLSLMTPNQYVPVSVSSLGYFRVRLRSPVFSRSFFTSVRSLYSWSCSLGRSDLFL